MKKILSFCLIICCFNNFLNSQITVSGGGAITADMMVSRIVGSGVTYSNPVFTGDNVSRGFFENANTTTPIQLGLNSGIVLTTGLVSDIPVNNVGNVTFDNNGLNNGVGSPINVLQGIADINTLRDGAILEFDFVTISNQISVKYIFGSDEYNEFVGDIYNDAFAFWISGPGITGEQNIAVVAGQPVTINTVNNGFANGTNVPNGPCQNCNFYRNNANSGSTATTIEYDGLTTVLTATATVQPCETYHIRLMIADAGDDFWDSGVFIEENGFYASGQGATTVIVNPGVDIENAVEGCNIFSTFIVNIPSPLNVPTTFDYTFTGTATYGVDFEAVPLSVTIPAGQTSASITFEIYDDGLVEGLETIILNIETSPCLVEQFTLNVTDPVPIVLNSSNGETCINQPFNLVVSASGGTGNLNYLWSNGAGTNSSVSVSPTETTTYTVTVSDQCGKSENETIQLTVFNLPSVDAGSYPTLCETSSDLLLNGSPVGGTFSGIGVIGGNFDPNVGTQLISYTYTDNNNCTNSAQTTIFVNPNPVVNIPPVEPICQGQTAIITTNVSLEGGTFVWAPDGQTTNSISVSPPLTSTFSVVYTLNGCESLPASGTLVVNPNIPVFAGLDTSICIGESVTLFAIGTPIINWLDGYINSEVLYPQITTTYVVEGTSENGCVTQDSRIVTVNPLPTINPGQEQTVCVGYPVVLEANGAGEGATYVWTNLVQNGEVFNPTNTNTYTVTGIDSNGCKNTASVTVTTLPFPIANFSPNPQSGYTPLTVDFINNSSNANSFFWDFGNGANAILNTQVSQQATYILEQSYDVWLFASNGYCTDSSKIVITVLPKPDVWAPNVFTPNNDEINGLFNLVTINIASINLQIFNRWGNLMAEITSLDGGWNGKSQSGEEATQGVYFYKYQAIGVNGEEFEGHGFLTLIR